MPRLLFIAVFIGLFCGSALTNAAAQDHGPEIVHLKTPLGVISFSHYEHQAKISDCNTCHHMGPAKGKCTGCHGVREGLPLPMKAFHDQCKGCHRESDGPMKCHQCHVKE